MILLWVNFSLYSFARAPLKIYRKDCTNTINSIIISSWPFLPKPVHRSSHHVSEKWICEGKNSLRREKMWICCMGSEQNLEVPILKLSPSSCLLLLSLSPGVVQHPRVPPVSPWNNNTLSGLLYLICAGSPFAENCSWQGKCQRSSADEITELPLGSAGIPGCLSGGEQRTEPFLLFLYK